MGLRASTRAGRLLVLVAALATALAVASMSPAHAVTKVYTATKTIPVPPSSAYAGVGGGDGWDLSMTPRAVYNIFHHSGQTYVACHLQSDASACGAARRITDADGNDFLSQGHSSTYLDQGTGRLFAWGVRSLDDSAGVICIDTTLADDTPNPFCGYDITAPAGQAMDYGSGAVSAAVRVGSKWYAFNYVDSTTNAADSAANKLMCFDLQTQDPCAGQPFDLGVAGTYSNGTFPAPAVSVAGGKVIVPIQVDGASLVTCFNPATASVCAGNWPAPTNSYPANQGSAFPVLDTTGAPLGFCIPNGAANDCYDFTAAALPVPENLPGVITTTQPWNGPPVVLGDRVYMANGSNDTIQCYDFGSGASCPNFPRSTNLGDQGYASYIYTINADPQRPECLWVNADNGSAQIQNFDAFTGGPCGSGALRVLASSIVQNDPQCVPDVYTQLKILAPAREGYDSGTVSFLDGNGQPIEGVSEQEIGPDGAVDLTGLDFTSDSGLPQFLISLSQTGETDLSAVTVELTWTGDADADCTPQSTVTVDPLHGQTGDTFTAGFSCPVEPLATVTLPDGSPTTDVTVGDLVTEDNLTYTLPITATAAGSWVVTVSCNGNDARSVVFDAVDPVPGTLGPGWPQAEGGPQLVWSYGGAHQFLANAVAGTDAWNGAVDGIGFTPWTGDATPVNLSFADLSMPDDLLALTYFPDGTDASYQRIFVYLNPLTLAEAPDGGRTKVTTHELGHVLGLPDEDPGSDNDSVMTQGLDGPGSPQPYDISRVEQRYP